jgi:hypothetical protein
MNAHTFNIEDITKVVTDIINNSTELHPLSDCISISETNEKFIAVHYCKNCKSHEFKTFDFSRIRHIIEDYGNFGMEEIDVGETASTVYKIYKIL